MIDKNPQFSGTLIPSPNDSEDVSYRSIFERADQMLQLGEFESAELLYKELLEQSPLSARVHNNLGALYQRMKRYDVAEDCFKAALQIDPKRLESQVNLGAIYQMNGLLGQAESCFRGALQINPNRIDACVNLGIVLRLSGSLVEAELMLNHAITCDPMGSEAYNNLGIVLHDLGRLKDAFMSFKSAVEINPNYAAAYNNMGSVFRDQKQLDPALACYRKALSLDKTFADAHNNTGAIYLSMGKLDDAKRHFRKALALKESFPEALTNLATIYRKKNQHDKAFDLYEQAIAADSEYAEAHFGLSELLLYVGKDLFRGWQEHKWRWKKIEFRSQWQTFDCPIWQGEPLNGKTILVWAEQGVGEEILYATMIPDLIEQGANVVLECEPRLVPLFQRSFPNVICFARKEHIDPSINHMNLDFHIAMGDLGEWVRPKLASFPNQPNNFRVDLNLRNALREKYKAMGQGPLIGISWKSTNADIGREKSLGLPEWVSVLTPSHQATFIDLQYGDTKIERQKFEKTTGVHLIHDDTIDQMQDLDAFAAQVAALDLVISISNTTVHVAGAVGVPTWTLLSSAPLWRWFEGHNVCLWYPSVQFFRQQHLGNWHAVIKTVSVALDEWLTHKPN